MHLNYCILAWENAAKLHYISDITFAHPSKKSSKVDHKPKLHSSRKLIVQETETINNK